MCTLVGVQVHVLPVIAFLFRLVLIKQTIPCLTDSFLSVPRYLDFVQTTTQATLSGFSLNKNSPGPLPCPASPTRCYSLPVLATLAFFAVLLSIVLPLSVASLAHSAVLPGFFSHPCLLSPASLCYSYSVSFALGCYLCSICTGFSCLPRFFDILR